MSKTERRLQTTRKATAEPGKEGSTHGANGVGDFWRRMERVGSKVWDPTAQLWKGKGRLLISRPEGKAS